MQKIKIDLSKLPEYTNKVYTSYYKNQNRYLIFYGGAGSGKSVFVAQKILYRLLTEQQHRFLIVRKVAKTLRHSVFPLFVYFISTWKLQKLFKINKTDMTITFLPQQNELLFFGLDDVEKLKSVFDITGIWIEEASEITQNDFMQLDLRLRGETKSYKQIILSFNPVSAESWLKEYFFDNKKDNTGILKTTYKDNKYIDEEYKEVLQSLLSKNKTFYKIYALGEWGVLKGLIYTNWEIINEFPKSFDDEFYGGDFGFNNPSAFVHIRVKDNNIYIRELLYQTGLTNSELINKLKINYNFLKNITGYLDSAEPDRIEEFKRYGFRVNPAKKSVKDGIDEVKSHKLFITKGSINILKEIKAYVWEEDKEGKSLDVPIKLNDHAMDAIRYAIFTRYRGLKKSQTKMIKF